MCFLHILRPWLLVSLHGVRNVPKQKRIKENDIYYIFMCTNINIRLCFPICSVLVPLVMHLLYSGVQAAAIYLGELHN